MSVQNDYIMVTAAVYENTDSRASFLDNQIEGAGSQCPQSLSTDRFGNHQPSDIFRFQISQKFSLEEMLDNT